MPNIYAISTTASTRLMVPQEVFVSAAGHAVASLATELAPLLPSPEGAAVPSCVVRINGEAVSHHLQRVASLRAKIMADDMPRLLRTAGMTRLKCQYAERWDEVAPKAMALISMAVELCERYLSGAPAVAARVEEARAQMQLQELDICAHVVVPHVRYGARCNGG